MLRQLWERFTRPPRRPARYARPRLELLECRAVPAAFENAVPLSLVDGGTVASSLDVPAQGRIVDLNVSIDLDHASAPDLTVTLVAPDGVTKAPLFSGLGSPGDPFHNVRVGVGGGGGPPQFFRIPLTTDLDDQAAARISAAAPPFDGTYRPAAPLSAFDGHELAGTWRLEITDAAQSGLSGTLYRWSLTAETATPADLVGTSFLVAEPAVAWGGTATVRYSIRNQGQTDAGPFTFEVRLSADAQITAQDVRVAAVAVGGLAAGSEVSGQLTVQLPGGVGSTPAGFAGLSEAYLGLLIDPDGAVPESDEANNFGQRSAYDVGRFTPITPAAEAEPNDSPALADVVAAPFQVDGALPANDQDYFRFDAPTTGRFVAGVDSTADVAVELYTAAGQLIVRTEPAPGAAAAIDQHLAPGGYLLRITPRVASPTIAYRLRGDFTPSVPPGLRQAPDTIFSSVTTADVNRDGRQDLIGASSDGLSILLGNGDGSFQARRVVGLGFLPSEVIAGDFDADGRPDLAVSYGGGVSVLMGEGDGSFAPPRQVAAGDFHALALADVNGDNVLDLLMIEYTTADVGVLLGNGDGTFGPLRRFQAGQFPTDVAAVDLDGDGAADLVVTDLISLQVFVLKGDGAGGFTPSGSFRVGDEPVLEAGDAAFVTGPTALAVADLDLDGRPDVITANNGSGDVSVLLGNGDGTFQPERRVKAGSGVVFVSSADVNRDGRADVLVSNLASGDVSVLLGDGDGSFQPQARDSGGGHPNAAFTADVNGDGRLDLISPNRDGGVSVLLGNGDGSFQTRGLSYAGAEPVSILRTDVNADGRDDLVIASFEDDTLSVLLGNGDGSFQSQRLVAVGDRPGPVTAADVNGDGRIDLIAGDTGTGEVSVLLGNGDGSFQLQRKFSLGAAPQFAVNVKPASIAAADFDGDGRPDLVVANAGIGNAFGDTTVSLLHGDGDGTFDAVLFTSSGPELLPGAAAVADLDGDGKDDFATVMDGGTVEIDLRSGNLQRFVAAGADLREAALGDVDGDGRPDLLVVNGSGDVFALHDLGGGDFGAPVLLLAGDGPRSLRAGDVDGDGLADLITFRSDSQDVLIYSAADGYSSARRVAVGFVPMAVSLADVDHDGRPDLVATDGAYDVSVSINAGGSFGPATVIRPGARAPTAVAGDFNGDGLPDQASIDRVSDELRVTLGDPGGGATSFADEQATPARNRPLLADVDGDGLRDQIVTDDRGRVLFRRGMRGGNLYQAPVVVNPDVLARDVAVVRTPAGFAIATTDVTGDTVSLYVPSGRGFIRSTVEAGRSPARLAAADLDGDGLDDLVVANPMTDGVRILMQYRDGAFVPTGDRAVGSTPVDVAFADVDGRDGVDVLIADRASGDVTVLFNDPSHGFTREARYRAGLTYSALDVSAGVADVTSPEQPVSLAVGDFTGDGLADVLVLAQGRRQVRLLEGTGTGFRDPIEPFRLAPPGEAAPARIGEARAADLDHDGDLDLAVDMKDRDQVWIYLNDGRGHFTLRSRVPAGDAPTGLTVPQLGDDNGDGVIDGRDDPDLLIGDGAGDELSVLGNGDGTFRPFVRADQRVPFVATDLDGDGRPDVVLADEARDRAAALTRQPVADGAPDTFTAAPAAFTPGAFQRDASGGLIGPGDVAVADVDGKYGDDLIFANTGSNNVLVYLRQADGSFAQNPLSFFTGTSPIDVHPAQLNDDNGDGLIDGRDLLDLVVANQGSNDVSILMGSRGRDANGDGRIDAQDLFEEGPRLASGGAGPNAVTTRDVTGDGVPDILVTNGQSGTMAVIPGLANVFGLGSGAFDGAATARMTLSDRPVIQTEVIGATLAFALTQDGTLLRFSPSGGGAAPEAVFVPQPGREVLAFSVVQTGQGFAGGSPVVFTANADGSVSLLTEPSGGAEFTEFVSGGSGLETPSALEVLERSDGVFEVYLTESGESQPVLLTLNLKAELSRSEPGDPFTPVVVLVTDLSGPADGPAASQPQPAPAEPAVETFDPPVAGLAAAASLEEVSLEGEQVGGSGQQLIGFVLKRQDGFAVGGEGDQDEPTVPTSLEEAEEAATPQDRVRGLIIGAKEEIERLVRPEQQTPEGEAAPAEEDEAPAEPQAEQAEQMAEEPVAAGTPAAEPEEERTAEAAHEECAGEEPAANARREREGGSAWAALPGLLLAVARPWVWRGDGGRRGAAGSP